MPIPFILGAAAVAAVTGIGAGVYGASKIKDAKDTMARAQSRHERNIRHYEETQGACNAEMDKLGTLEMQILNSFERFSDLIEKIHNRPKFEDIDLGDRTLPRYDPQHLREVSLGAVVLLGSLSVAAAGMVGGAIFASKLSDKADEAWDQVKQAEEKIDTVCTFLNELQEAAAAYREMLESVQSVYSSHMDFLAGLLSKKRDWSMFSDTEKLNVKNLVHLASLLYSMCKVKLVLKSEEGEDLNVVNEADIDEQMMQAEKVLDQIPVL